MPVAPTYPGVYIEEVPSGVHTLTGVSTAITAFVGYTPRGPVDEPVHIFNFGDFERAFDGLAVDSPLSYAVSQFFQNGGGEAYVVRVAKGARPSMVSLKNSTTGGATVLDVTAASAGTWGNALRIDIDYDTASPSNLFNLTATEFTDQAGQLVPGRVEVFRNLSMNSFDPGFVVSAVNAGSQLIRVARPAGLAMTGAGTSESGSLQQTDVDMLKAAAGPSPPNRVAASVDGGPTVEVTFPPPNPTGTVGAAVTKLATDIASALNSALGTTITGAAVSATIPRLRFTSAAGERSSVRFYDASSRSATAILKLGAANGGTEIDGAAGVRPVQSGTTGTAVATTGLPATGGLTVNVFRGASTTAVATPTLPLWTVAPTTVGEVLDALRKALRESTVPEIAAATASLVGGALRVVGDPLDPLVSFTFANASTADTSATTIGLAAAGSTRNLARYTPGSGANALAQVSGQSGANGTAPTQTELTGDEAAKTGFHALEKVDLFNLLVIPDALADDTVLSAAIAYCVRRRAFVIIDAPATVTDFATAQAWIQDAKTAKLRSRNSALYFPRLLAADPLMNNVVKAFPAAGALAGLYARTDAGPGVWKAPAGISATLFGVDGLSVTLTDAENGVLNPKGLNCLRTFPVLGSVSWGARSGWGDDARADEYKYIPVRRLALFLEESLYRGTQWAVFEPNDEPLWAQIRLNLGAFMHGLFRQGAFQGRTPKDAYFVKCDGETTTQNDINLGRVNVVVGFAPLKPAEFVVIKIQQIAGAIQT